MAFDHHRARLKDVLEIGDTTTGSLASRAAAGFSLSFARAETDSEPILEHGRHIRVRIRQSISLTRDKEIHRR